MIPTSFLAAPVVVASAALGSAMLLVVGELR